MDLDSMSKVPGWLTNIKEYVDRLHGMMPQLANDLGTDGVQATGTYPGANRVYAQAQQAYIALDGQLNATSSQVAAAIAVTQQIVQNYTTTEALNKANAADIEKLFTDQGGSATASASTFPSASSSSPDSSNSSGTDGSSTSSNSSGSDGTSTSGGYDGQG
ncbi:hypothetical protein [Fodinicola feengrottensis]|uniref:hypothetical protein n=1 Tax=Fodinicola feengrottensis TaxID=435914 RepID=UPI002441632B|nr:hypothetical protein [Fodinicola feengrottensis]